MSKLIAFIAAALLTSTAMAGDRYDQDKSQRDMSTSAATFDALDKNGDAQISKTEAADNDELSTSFASLDVNGDGYLNKSEYATTRQDHDSDSMTRK